MATLKLNFNDSIRVRLTQRGIDRYRDWSAEHGARTEPPPQDHEGYRTFQLWDMMSCYGPVISMGLSDLFELNAQLILTEPIGGTDADGTQAEEVEPV